MPKSPTSFRPGNTASRGHGRPKGASNAIRQLARSDEADAYMLIREAMMDADTPLPVRVGAAELIVTWSRGRTPQAPYLHEAIEGLDLSTEAGCLEALRTITMACAEGRIPSDHAKNLILLVATVIHAERGELESKVTLALSQMREVLEGRQQVPSA